MAKASNAIYPANTWLQFMLNGKVEIGIVQYIKPDRMNKIEHTIYMTNKGPVSHEQVVEAR